MSKKTFNKYWLVLLFAPALGSSTGFCQNIAGQWDGYFIQQNLNGDKEKYRFKLNLNQTVNNSITGYSFSTKDMVFYGKAKIQGIFNPSTQNLLLKEIALLDMKITNGGHACLMTCYLDYAQKKINRYVGWNIYEYCR